MIGSASIFDKTFTQFDYELTQRQEGLPIGVILPHIAPRDPRLQYELEFGRGFIQDVFDHNPLPETVRFSFPERWMWVAEQQAFIPELKRNPTTFQRVELITQAPLIIGNFRRHAVLILKFDTGMSEFILTNSDGTHLPRRD